jgi:hypothetical protein
VITVGDSFGKFCAKAECSDTKARLAAFVTSILAGPHSAARAEEPPIRQIIEVLQQVMCIHDAEKLAISVLGIYKGETSEWRSPD